LGLNIRLHIEELVLEGFAPAECYRIGQTVQQELTRLLAEQARLGAFSQAGAAEYFDGGTIVVASESNSVEIGRGVAQAIYKGLNL
jgi:hypothetical protein